MTDGRAPSISRAGVLARRAVGDATAKRLELIAYCRPEVPQAVHGDAGRVRQILLDLASDAVRLTSAVGGSPQAILAAQLSGGGLQPDLVEGGLTAAGR